MINKYLECGKIINKRGIRGEVKAECYCDSPKSLSNVKKLYLDSKGKDLLSLTAVKEYKGFMYLTFSEIDSAEKADEMRGKTLFVDRDDLEVEEGKVFIADILGLDVIDADSGKIYGKVTDIQNYGACDIYVISDGKNTYMLPDADGMVVSVDTQRAVYVRAISGIFDDAEEIR